MPTSTQKQQKYYLNTVTDQKNQGLVLKRHNEVIRKTCQPQYLLSKWLKTVYLPQPWSHDKILYAGWFCQNFPPVEREFSFSQSQSLSFSGEMMESKRGFDALCWFPLLGSVFLNLHYNSDKLDEYDEFHLIGL